MAPDLAAFPRDHLAPALWRVARYSKVDDVIQTASGDYLRVGDVNLGKFRNIVNAEYKRAGSALYAIVRGVANPPAIPYVTPWMPTEADMEPPSDGQ